MNKNILIVAVVGVIILIVGGVFLLNQNSSKSNGVTVGEKTSEQMTEDGDSIMMKEDSRYVEYSNGVLEESKDKRRVLYFYANWCPICRPADADFKANMNSIPEDVVVIRVNYNDTDTDSEEEALADKYEVPYQHTFVQIDENGQEITRWSGGQLEDLLANIK